MQTEISDGQYRLYQSMACIKINRLPVYVEHFLHRDPETAINKACFRLFNNLLFYGLEAAHKDLQAALNSEQPYKLTVNFGKP